MINKHTIIGKENDGSDITLGDLQSKLKSMLKDVINVLDNNKIFYFAAEGTLLGAIRHSDMIPWDDDIDLGFRLQDYKTILDILTSQLDDKYVIQCFDTNNKYNVTQPIIKIRLKNTYVEYDAFYDKNNCDCNGIFIDLIAFSACCPTNRDFLLRKLALIRTIILLGFNYLNINIKFLKQHHINIANRYANKNKNSIKVGYALNFVPWRKYIYDKKDFEKLIEVKFDDFNIKVPVGYDNILKNLYGYYMIIPQNNDVKLFHSKNIKLKGNLK